MGRKSTRRSQGSTSSADKAGLPVDESAKKNDSAEVVICGQRTRTTARGRAVLEPSEDFSGALENSADNAAYQAAKERRQRMERTMKLEQYQEKKLSERIQVLEQMREAELSQQA